MAPVTVEFDSPIYGSSAHWAVASRPMKSLPFLSRIKLKLAKVYHSHDGKPYEFGHDDDRCRISFFSTHFCVFENILISPPKLHINHFSIEYKFRGCLIGEKCLRKFANRISLLDASIDSIEFKLHKTPTNSNQLKIAQGRLALLKRIGASNTSMKPLAQGKFEVCGSWHKTKWL